MNMDADPLHEPRTRRFKFIGCEILYREACFLAATGVMVLLTLLVRATTSLAADQSYFVVVLSALLMHYYFDHFLFTHPQLVE